MLRAVSTEPDAALELMNGEIMTWAEVRCLTNGATQVPRCCFEKTRISSVEAAVMCFGHNILDNAVCMTFLMKANSLRLTEILRSFISSVTPKSKLSWFFFFFFYVYLFILRERETETERENPKQAPGSELSAQSPTRGPNSRTKRPWPDLKLDT